MMFVVYGGEKKEEGKKVVSEVMDSLNYPQGYGDGLLPHGVLIRIHLTPVLHHAFAAVRPGRSSVDIDPDEQSDAVLPADPGRTRTLVRAGD
jgi:hypothetical protein